LTKIHIQIYRFDTDYGDELYVKKIGDNLDCRSCDSFRLYTGNE